MNTKYTIEKMNRAKDDTGVDCYNVPQQLYTLLT